jgi:hypothetical protein
MLAAKPTRETLLMAQVTEPICCRTAEHPGRFPQLRPARRLTVSVHLIDGRQFDAYQNFDRFAVVRRGQRRRPSGVQARVATIATQRSVANYSLQHPWAGGRWPPFTRVVVIVLDSVASGAGCRRMGDEGLHARNL